MYNNPFNYNINSEKPIGFYDSGVGGINVLYETMRLMPNENFIYYGDNLNAPYGEKDENTIKLLSLKCGEFLFKKDVKAIVIACNTATSIVVKSMRELYNIPVFSMEPAIKPAKEAHKSGSIIVLATNATLNQQRYRLLIKQLGAEDRIKNIACPELVEFIEKGELASADFELYLKNLMFRLKNYPDICAIVLGCTHFSYAHDLISEAAKKYLNLDCTIYDGKFGTAKYVKKHLAELNLLSKTQKPGHIKFFSSADNKYKQILFSLCKKNS